MEKTQTDEKKMVGVRFDQEEHHALKRAANAARMSMGGFCAVAALEKMKKMERRGYKWE